MPVSLTDRHYYHGGLVNHAQLEAMQRVALRIQFVNNPIKINTLDLQYRPSKYRILIFKR